MTYRPDVDGLRAIAIVAVVAYHAGVPGFGGGFVGVDVFFVISGFLITRLLADELGRQGTISLREFYARRFRRLLPALALVLLGVVILSSFVFPGLGDTRRFAASVRWSALGLANVFFKRNTGGYFDGPTAEMPLLHLWSLAVEEQFYLVWPLLMLLARGRRLKWVLTALVAASLLGAEWLIRSGNASEAFYLMPWRAWELGVGALLAGLSREPSRPMREGAGILGLGAIAVSVAGFSAATPFPGVSALLPVGGSALLLWAGSGGASRISAALAWRPLVSVGLLSYGWYLWHWPLLAIAHARSLGEALPLAWRSSLIGASLAIAAASFRWIETPIRQGRFWRSIRPLRTVTLGLAVNAVVFGAGLAIPGFEVRALSLRLGGRLVEQVLEQTSAHECFEQKKIGVPLCNYSFAAAGDKARTIAVWGDSHACSYFPMVEDYVRSNHLNAAPYCAGDTPPFVGRTQVTGREKDALALASFGEAVIWDLKRKLEAAPVSVVLAARWGHYETMGADAMERNLKGTLEELTKTGVSRILVILPYPEFRHPTLRCLLGSDPRGCRVARLEADRRRRPIVEALRAAVAGFPNARSVDPLPLVCGEDECPQVLDGMPVVFDDNHPTVAAASLIGTKVREQLDWLAGAGK